MKAVAAALRALFCPFNTLLHFNRIENTTYRVYSWSMWNIDFRYIQSWLQELSDDDYEQVVASLQVLEREGPALGRPLVDNIKYSTIKNLKELRPGSSGQSKIRILFVFDPRRQAVMLVAGDKSGNWNKWYRTNVPRAGQIYKEHLRNL